MRLGNRILDMVTLITTAVYAAIRISALSVMAKYIYFQCCSSSSEGMCRKWDTI